MNLLHGDSFSPYEDFFVNPISIVVSRPNPMYIDACTGAV